VAFVIQAKKKCRSARASNANEFAKLASPLCFQMKFAFQSMAEVG
jgi:hypothetical protein